MTTIRYDMSNEEYHASDALSASGAKTIALESLFDFKYAEREHKAAFDVGTATHTLVFEPHLGRVGIPPEISVITLKKS